MRMITVSDMMSTMLITLSPNDDLSLAEDIMRLGRIRHVPVVEADGALAGLVTHRDLLAAAVTKLAGLSHDEDKLFKRSILAHEVMTRAVRSVSPDTTALEAAVIMRENQFGCLPVVEGGALVGIVTEADFIDLVIDALKSAEHEAEEEEEAEAAHAENFKDLDDVPEG